VEGSRYVLIWSIIPEFAGGTEKSTKKRQVIWSLGNKFEFDSTESRLYIASNGMGLWTWAMNGLGSGIHSVTIKFPNLGHKKHIKKSKEIFINTVTQYGPISSAQRLHRSYNKSNARENASSHIAFSSLVTACWVIETASNLVSFITVFNSGNKKVSRC
jgi:hypothetical protein